MDLTKQIQIAVARTDIALSAAWRFLRVALPVTAAVTVAVLVIVKLCKRG